MPPKDISTLLADERFLNYCLRHSEADVLYWEEYLRQQPQERAMAEQAKALVLHLRQQAAQQEAAQGYQHLQAQLAVRRSPSRVRLRARVVRRVAAWSTAAVLLGGAVGLYVYRAQQQATTDYAELQRADIGPGGNSAVLTLADGRRIDLGHAALGELGEQNGVQLSKTAAGQLEYHGTAATSAGAALNTVATPARGQFTLVLPDGTHVWLNAQSTLSYSPAFADETRLVRLTGEAYFEVAPQLVPGSTRRWPFVVETGLASGDRRAQRIEVLGTHFNVSSYADEPQSVTTLLEGRVQVSTPLAAGAARPAYVLHPGQQLRLGTTGSHLETVDPAAAVAWKNGEFVFREDLPSALRKVARWYGVEVVYTDTAPRQLQLGGWISRQKNISDVLHLLEATGEVHFQLAGRRVIVTK